MYAAGHPRFTPRGFAWAAVLACGGADAAVLSHRSAAWSWDLVPSPARAEVTTFAESRSTARIRVHRSRTLRIGDDDAEQHDGLPVTTPTRTLVDLADVLTPHALERACHRAELLRLLDAAAIAASLARLPGRRAHALRDALATLAHADPDVTRSELEERFLLLVTAGGLLPPLVNARVAGHEVDILWPTQRLVAELDGAAAHRTPMAFEGDRRRDASLQVAGYRVVRFTWRQVIREPTAVITTLRALLAPLAMAA